MTIYSHPGIPYKNHIKSIEEYDEYLHSINLNVKEVIKFHDIGKTNTAFQRRMKLAALNKNPKKEDWDNHAVLSTIVFLLHKNLEQDISEWSDDKIIDMYIALNIIRGHHGSLISPDDLGKKIFDWQKNKDTIKLLRASPDTGTNLYKKIIEIANGIEQEENPLMEFAQLFRTNFTYDKWTLDKSINMRMAFSRFVDCDRLSAAMKCEFVEDVVRIHPLIKDENNVGRFISGLSQREGYLKELENQVKEQMLKWRTCPESGVYLLSLPTGLGKTLTSLQIAEWWGNKTIYTSPFLSVTDQTEKVVRDVYKADITDKRITIHHSMAQIADKEDEKEENDEDNDKNEIDQWTMMERWSGSFVVTTVVQFFESMMSNKGTKLRKLHNTYGATILLDEPQTIDHQRWETIKELLPEWCEQYKWKVILLSATPPSLPRYTIDMIRIDDNKLKRTKINMMEDVREDKWIDKAWSLTSDKQSILWIVNTKKRAKAFYTYIENNIKCENTYLIHGDLSKLQRTVILNNIRDKMKNGEKVLVLSTQVLEAGVDLDFEAVVRELAPLPTLIQVAGRLNRKAHRDRETAYVLPIKEGGSSLYGDREIRLTREILSDELLEEEYRSKCDTYYSELEIYKDDTYLNNYIHISKEKFKMIDDKEDTYKVQAVSIHNESDQLKKAWRDLTGKEYISSDNIIWELIKSIRNKDFEGIRKWKRYLSLYMGKIDKNDVIPVTVDGKIVCWKENKIN